MTDRVEKFKPEETALDSTVGKSSEVSNQEVGLNNEKNQKIHDRTQEYQKIDQSASDLLVPRIGKEIPIVSQKIMELEDHEKGIVHTGAGLLPMVPEDVTVSLAENLQAIDPCKSEADLNERKGEGTLKWMEKKGMLEAMLPPNFMALMTPEMQAGLIAAFQNGSQIDEHASLDTTDDVLTKNVQNYVDAIDLPADMVFAAGKSFWGILEFERDLMFNPERMQDTAGIAGDYIGKALVGGIKLWIKSDEYSAGVQQNVDYRRPFQDLGNAVNKWYDSLTPGDQMHVMADISAGFGLNVAAGELKELAKPDSFVQFLQETAEVIPKIPKAQQKAAETVKRLIESFSRYNGLAAADSPAIDRADNMFRIGGQDYSNDQLLASNIPPTIPNLEQMQQFEDIKSDFENFSMSRDSLTWEPSGDRQIASKVNDYPKDAQSWKAELKQFKDQLTVELGHKPTQVDYARIICKSNTPENIALNAALLYTFNMRPRAEEGEFAFKHAESMLVRSRANDLKPENPKELDADAIHQNFPDSCPLMSAMIGMARRSEGRVALSKMVQENKDGSYTVTFPGNKTKPLTVSRLTAGEKMIGSSTDQGFLLPAVIEKAYGQYLNQQRSPSDQLPIQSEATKFGSDNYGDGIKFLTGHDVKKISTRRALNPQVFMNEDFLRDALSEAQKVGAIALAGIKGAPEPMLHKMGIHDHHAYVVTGFDSNGITIRDTLPLRPRIFTLTWKQFNDNFNDLIIEKKNGE
ncbi:hypothetical protein GC174_15050 [bacterium]|nr:hypothetical protein [bacterium]